MKPNDQAKDILFSKAKLQYQGLLETCALLEKEGYWEKPQSILKQSIFDMLDCYLQALLIQQTKYCDRLRKEELTFVFELSNQNQTFFGADAAHDAHIAEIIEEKGCEKELNNIQKVIAAPPILIQLCGLRDQEHDSDLAGTFLDGVLNIMIAMSYYENPKESRVLRYMQEYYTKVSAFLDFRSGTCKVTPRYLFLKLSKTGYDECCMLYKKYEEIPRNISQPQGKEEVLEASDLTQNANEVHTDEVHIDKQDSNEVDMIKIDVDETIQDEEFEENSEQNAEKYKEPAIDFRSLKIYNKEQEKQSLQDFIEELHALIGLDEVKNEVQSLINLIKVRKMREAMQMPSMDMTYHMVFTGNPGTGKTTVARLIARIYQELGILSKGTLVETDRAGLVAGYVGQTALKVKSVVEKAIGGVLFIDEAYALTNNTGSNDFGLEAVDTLVKMMEDNRDDLVVIVASYKEEMKEFLASNTGLVSRFNKYIDFKDYNDQELYEILQKFAENAQVTLSEAANECVRRKIAEMTEERKQQFGNARGIRNCFEKIMVNQANRIVLCEEATKDLLCRIEEDDVEFRF